MDYHFLHHITLGDGIYYFQPFINFSKHRVIAIEMAGGLTGVANEKLGATCIATGMSHGQNPPIVVLIASR